MKETDNISNSASSELVTIGRPSGKQAADWRTRAANGPIADKFFALGAIFAVVGTLMFGLYLWLVLNSILPLEGSYTALRRAHAIIQVYLFFGLFILGFISQAGSKMLGAKLDFAAKPLIFLPLYIIGSLGMMFSMHWAALLVSAIFAGYASRIAYVCIRGCERPIQAALSTLGLSVLAAAPFLSVENQYSALLVAWGGFGSLIFAASAQFIAAFLNGKPLQGRLGLLFVFLHAANVLLLMLGPALDSKYTALLALLELAVYLYATTFTRWFSSAGTNALSLAFVFGYIWSIVAWGIVLLGNYTAPDLTMHILVIGWAAPLIFAVSTQVVAFMTGRDTLLPKRLWWSLLLLWQVVPLGRGAFHTLGLPTWFSLLVAGASITVLLSWAAAICSAEWSMLRLQATLQKGESLKSCG